MSDIFRCEQAIRAARSRMQRPKDLVQELDELNDRFGSPVFEAATHNLDHPSDRIDEVDDNNWRERGFDSWDDADRFDYQCDKDD